MLQYTARRYFDWGYGASCFPFRGAAPKVHGCHFEHYVDVESRGGIAEEHSLNSSACAGNRHRTCRKCAAPQTAKRVCRPRLGLNRPSKEFEQMKIEWIKLFFGLLTRPSIILKPPTEFWVEIDWEHVSIDGKGSGVTSHISSIHIASPLPIRFNLLTFNKDMCLSMRTLPWGSPAQHPIKKTHMHIL